MTNVTLSPKSAKAAKNIQILLTKVGDYYEATGEDARMVAHELQLTVTRSRCDPQTPLCGFPYHSLTVYTSKLEAAGYSVLVK
jgi:DNA mismatch repair protein MutS